MLYVDEMGFKDRLRDAREEAGLTQAQLAELVGVSQAAIQSLESGRVKSTTSLLAIAKAINVYPDWLQNGKEPRRLPPIEQKSHKEISKDDYKPPFESRIIPVISWEDAVLGEEASRKYKILIDNLVVSSDMFSDKSFALIMKGDSMVSDNPLSISFREGEGIVIDPLGKLQDGKFVLALLPRATQPICRKYIIEGGLPYLQALNPAWKRIEMTDEIKILGIVGFHGAYI